MGVVVASGRAWRSHSPYDHVIVHLLHHLDELFITTAARPAGGQLFRAKMPFGIKGLPEPEWQGGD